MLNAVSRTHPMLLALLGAVCVFAALMPGWFAQAQTTTAIPQLMLPATAGWTAFLTRATDPAAYLPDDYLHGGASIERAISLGAPPDKVAAYLLSRSFNEWISGEWDWTDFRRPGTSIL